MDDGFYRNLLNSISDGIYVVDKERKVVFWNRGAEAITGYERSEILETHCYNGKLKHLDQMGNDLCRGKCALALTIEDGRSRQEDVFLHHRDGHRIPVSMRVSPVKDAGGAVVGAVEIFLDISSRIGDIERIEQLQKMAFLDDLTGIASRRYLEMRLKDRLAEMERYRWKFGVLLIDIDHFKPVNDTYGHAVGDRMLKMIAKTLSANTRSLDLVGRWGGEEFLALIASVDPTHLAAIGDRYRVLVERSSLPMPGGPPLRTTISLGGTLARGEDTADSLLERADSLMYRSKSSGRNRVSLDP
jgi:diguanylate cyclase (GGDEF)-like protein/PAS domain S-box-containing protein